MKSGDLNPAERVFQTKILSGSLGHTQLEYTVLDRYMYIYIYNKFKGFGFHLYRGNLWK